MSAELAEYLAPVLPIVKRLVDGEISGQEFDAAFFRRYPDLVGQPAEDVFLETERFFAQAEDHVPDGSLRESGDVSTEQLIVKARELLRSAGM